MPEPNSVRDFSETYCPWYRFLDRQVHERVVSEFDVNQPPSLWHLLIPFPSRYHGLNKILLGHAETLRPSFREEVVNNFLQCRFLDLRPCQDLLQSGKTFFW